ncbi:hypothetical protein pdul_cds_868 [Pandoravirus dulcis]|uniref:Uncharacterized protein n=1 Tax=Pandoravirus dulcis TaxID=1349409 RepID=S4VZ01_9VIRU|nr:hypothetical protein pdul_cds_868 [Pandoravirus dulcis]AGO83089.1 hypothetical protein pdul_cds_868 [Pandoravirus dulcis]
MATTTPTANGAPNGGGGDVGPPWSRLPPELWREVLFHCRSDRDLYACLCAARCFHVLAPGDLAARFYADATVEGMCAAGNLVGLEYVMAHRPASAPPVDWVMCLYDAALANRGDKCEMVARVLAQSDCHTDDIYGWEQARAVVAETDDPLLRALAALVILAAPIAASDDPADARRVDGAMERMDSVWSHASFKARADTVERCSRLGAAWKSLVARFVLRAITRAAVDSHGAGVCVTRTGDWQLCHEAGDYDGARRVSEQLMASSLFGVERLVREGRLDDAVALMVDPTARANLPPLDASRAIVRVAEASARAGRIDLLGALGCFDVDGMAALDAMATGGAQKARTAAFYQAATAGYVCILERLGASTEWRASVIRAHPDVVAVVVAGDHLDCMRWLCKHEFPTATAQAWCAPRARYASALSLALVRRHIDLANLILQGVDGQAAGRRAFDEAVAAGDLRVARYVRSVCPSALPHPMIAQKSYSAARATPIVLIPVNHS